MRAILGWILASVVLLSACNNSAPVPTAPGATAATPFIVTADMKQLMNWIMDPHADIVWASVGTVVTAEGEQNFLPRTEEEWAAVRNSAATLVETANLLMLPGRARNQDDWMTKAREFGERAQEVVAAAEAKDTASLFTAGSDMYLACAGCHTTYVIGEAAPK